MRNFKAFTHGIHTNTLFPLLCGLVYSYKEILLRFIALYTIYVYACVHYPLSIYMCVYAGAAVQAFMEGIMVQPQLLLPMLFTDHEVDLLTPILSAATNSVLAAAYADPGAFYHGGVIEGMEKGRFDLEGLRRLRVQLGALVETPRACIRADCIAAANRVDFVTIDSSRLSQLVLGVSRQDAHKFMVSTASCALAVPTSPILYTFYTYYSLLLLYLSCLPPATADATADAVPCTTTTTEGPILEAATGGEGSLRVSRLDRRGWHAADGCQAMQKSASRHPGQRHS